MYGITSNFPSLVTERKLYAPPQHKISPPWEGKGCITTHIKFPGVNGILCSYILCPLGSVYKNVRHILVEAISSNDCFSLQDQMCNDRQVGGCLYKPEGTIVLSVSYCTVVLTVLLSFLSRTVLLSFLSRTVLLSFLSRSVSCSMCFWYGYLWYDFNTHFLVCPV